MGGFNRPVKRGGLHVDDAIDLHADFLEVASDFKAFDGIIRAHHAKEIANVVAAAQEGKEFLSALTKARIEVQINHQLLNEHSLRLGRAYLQEIFGFGTINHAPRQKRAAQIRHLESRALKQLVKVGRLEERHHIGDSDKSDDVAQILMQGLAADGGDFGLDGREKFFRQRDNLSGDGSV